MTVRERDPYLYAAGSFFLPGLGQVYYGRILRGVVFLIPALLLTIPHSILQLSIILNWFPYELWLKYLYSFVTPVERIIDFAVRVISTYDAYKVAKDTHI